MFIVQHAVYRKHITELTAQDANTNYHAFRPKELKCILNRKFWEFLREPPRTSSTKWWKWSISWWLFKWTESSFSQSSVWFLKIKCSVSQSRRYILSLYNSRHVSQSQRYWALAAIFLRARGTEPWGPIFWRFHGMPWSPNGRLNVSGSCLTIFRCLECINIDISIL